MSKRPPEDLDPRGEDVASKPRRRRHRTKPEPKARDAAAKPELLARALRRPVPPAVMFEREGNHYAIQPPHSDPDLWELMLADAFATRSQSVIRAFVFDLKALCSKVYDDQEQAWRPNEQELNAILAMVASAKPKTTAEAALVAQSVAVHLLTMRLSAQALNRGGMVMERDAALVGKLARTYTLQMDQLQAMRGKRRTTRQSIKVSKELHQHVHYHDARGGGENGSGPHGRASSSPDERPPLRCIEQSETPLPVPSSPGAITLLSTRREKHGGSR